MTRSLPTTQLQQNNTRGRGAGPAAHRQAQGHSPSPARPAHLARVPPTRSGIRVNVFQPALSAPLVRRYAYLVSTRCSECTAQDHPPAPTLGVSSPRRYLDLKGTLGVTGTLPPELFGSKMTDLIAVRVKNSSLSARHAAREHLRAASPRQALHRRLPESALAHLGHHLAHLEQIHSRELIASLGQQQ